MADAYWQWISTRRFLWLFRRSSVSAHSDTGTTLDDLRESVETLAEMERNAGRVFGAAHPLVATIARCLRNSRAALDARETSCTCVPVPLPPS